MTPEQIQTAIKALRVISDGFKHLPGQHDQSTHGNRGDRANDWVKNVVWWHGASKPGMTKLSARNAPSRYPAMGRYYSVVRNNFATTSYEEAVQYARESARQDEQNGIEGVRPVVYQVKPTSTYAEPDPNGAVGGWGAAFESMQEAYEYWDAGGDVAIAFHDDMDIVQEIDPDQYAFGDVPEVKTRHVRDADYWKAPVGTPLPLDRTQTDDDVIAAVRDATANGMPMGLYPLEGTGDEDQLAVTTKFVREHSVELNMIGDDAWRYQEALVARDKNREHRQQLRDLLDDTSYDMIVDQIDFIRREGELHIAIDPTALFEVLREGRFKSQFESNSSNGSLNQTGRSYSEALTHDLNPNLPAAKRPIYGYISPRVTVPAGVDQYGHIRVVLKDSVRDRTTITLGDSLGSMAVPVPLTGDVTKEQMFNASFGYGEGQKQFAEGIDITDYADEEGEYVEAQILGGVTVDDIAEILYPEDWNPDVNPYNEQRDIDRFKVPAEALGIKVGTYERRGYYDHFASTYDFESEEELTWDA